MPPRPINSFEKLASDVTSYFAAKVARPEDPDRMMKITQGKDETDGDYIDRLDEIVLTSEPISDKLALYSVQRRFGGLSPIFRNLAKDLPRPTRSSVPREANFLARRRLLEFHLGEGAAGESAIFRSDQGDR